MLAACLLPTMKLPRNLLIALTAVSLGAGCLAPAPPIVVETPFGDVRAESERTAKQFAALYEVDVRAALREEAAGE